MRESWEGRTNTLLIYCDERGGISEYKHERIRNGTHPFQSESLMKAAEDSWREKFTQLKGDDGCDETRGTFIIRILEQTEL